ncbi:4-hydroxybenzoate octaprenyltransferase [Asticcacaulis sp. EMRT-3]|uniref:4-hydroxybenzoate octaprenyltransferase n=1 Tax=Asticcacaulis sp. EMRT-3 TaxID=3040349 RepID=UPI0024AF8548|nr:4-hydroxybenzoate octaprenyltransferase [Asticcacaulis sp. EMRT-3]MDI7774079.1 4-hydroxybenzoate octaprenyltransferase [Asticcacaulis sp. EMRT-3]
MTASLPDQSPPAPLPDAPRLNWVDRYAPAALRPWLRLGRFDRPIGIWLLFLPGAMGLALGMAHPIFAIDALHPDITHPQWNGRAALSIFPYGKLLLFFIGAALMRAAGCAYNDFIDRDFDAQVERTRGRPIPSGQISPKQALLFVAACSLISLAILVQLGTLAIILGVASLGLVAAYPFMKRITWWPQAWLGLTFNWGLLMGYATMTGRLDVPALVFYAGLVFWTLGYDTIYALQDIEDDILIGVKSSARALGRHTVDGVAIFYGLAVVLTGLAGTLAHLPFLFFAGILAVGGHFFWQVTRLQPDSGERALILFKSNRTVGLLWFLGLVLVHVSGRFHV